MRVAHQRRGDYRARYRDIPSFGTAFADHRHRPHLLRYPQPHLRQSYLRQSYLRQSYLRQSYLPYLRQPLGRPPQRRRLLLVPTLRLSQQQRTLPMR
jgi:hypothetical protein